MTTSPLVASSRPASTSSVYEQELVIDASELCHNLMGEELSRHVIAPAGPANAAPMEHALEARRLGPMSRNELAWLRRAGRAIDAPEGQVHAD